MPNTIQTPTMTEYGKHKIHLWNLWFMIGFTMGLPFIMAKKMMGHFLGIG